jgi:hypothetical protein
MKYFLLVFFSFYFGVSIAQTENYDTIYHPYYQGKRLVELKSNKDKYHLKGFNETEINLARNILISKYVILNEKGDVQEIYNDFDGSLKTYFQKKKANKTVEIKPQIHKLKTENSAQTVGADNSGFNILYPVYEVKNIKGGKGKVGLMDSLGKFIFLVEFDRIQYIDSVFITQKNNQFQLYSFDFQLLLQDYDSIEYISTYKDHILLKKGSKYGLIRRDGTYILQTEYEVIRNSKYKYMNYEFQKNGLWGFLDWSLTRYLPPFSPSPNIVDRDGYFEYLDENKIWNLLDSNGKILVKSPMDIYLVLPNQLFCVTKYDRELGYQRSIMNNFGEIVSKRVYYDLWRVNENTLLAGFDAKILDASELKKSSKWQLLYPNGETKNDEIYSNIQILDSNYLKVYDNKGNITVINDLGHDALGFPVEDVYKYDKHLYKIKRDNKHIFIDLANPQYYSAAYENLQCVKEHRIAVTNNKKWGFIDESYNVIFPLIADRVTCFEDGVATVEIDGKSMMIDLNGKYINTQKFDLSKTLSNGYTQVVKDSKHGIINSRGQFTVPMVYDEIKFVINDGDNYYIGAKRNGKYGIINIQNELVYPFEFDYCAEISPYSSGIAQKRSEGFFAFMQLTKRTKVERYFYNFDYKKNVMESVNNYAKGFEIVKEPCNLNANQFCYGVKNWDGQYVIPCRFLYISDFKYNTFRISETTGGGLIDTLGNILIPLKYKYLYDLSGDDKLIQVGHHQGNWGLYNYSGKMIADTLFGGFEKPEFGLIPFYKSFNYRFDANHKWIHDEKKVGLMDMKGKILIEPIYDRYTVPDQRKKEIQFVNEENIIWVNEKGEITKSDTRLHYSTEIRKPEIPQVPPSKKGKKKKKARWL